jgi:hypothetical protein
LSLSLPIASYEYASADQPQVLVELLNNINQTRNLVHGLLPNGRLPLHRPLRDGFPASDFGVDGSNSAERIIAVTAESGPTACSVVVLNHDDTGIVSRPPRLRSAERATGLE